VATSGHSDVAASAYELWVGRGHQQDRGKKIGFVPKKHCDPALVFIDP
jgi:hypothetical protein